jgi:uncharacterized OB-fold protein
MTADGPPFRLLPRVDDTNRFFWESGADGTLRFQRCEACETFVHPPAPRCPFCLTDSLVPTAVSGRATVASYTVNHQQWVPGADPYVIAWVAIDEDPAVRLTTNLVGLDDAAVERLEVGAPVEVLFEHHEDVWLPLFRLAASR